MAIVTVNDDADASDDGDRRRIDSVFVVVWHALTVVI